MIDKTEKGKSVCINGRREGEERLDRPGSERRRPPGAPRVRKSGGRGRNRGEAGGPPACGTAEAGEQDSRRAVTGSKKGLQSVPWTLGEAQLKDRPHGEGRARLANSKSAVFSFF